MHSIVISLLEKTSLNSKALIVSKSEDGDNKHEMGVEHIRGNRFFFFLFFWVNRDSCNRHSDDIFDVGFEWFFY